MGEDILTARIEICRRLHNGFAEFLNNLNDELDIPIQPAEIALAVSSVIRGYFFLDPDEVEREN